MSYNNTVIDFFVGMRVIEDLFEFIYEGLQGGIHRYNVKPNNGKFDKDFLKKFIFINQGDSDFDYELGRLGYSYLSSDDGLKELSKYYLNELKSFNNRYISEDVVKNCKNSLLNIIK